MRWTSDTSLKYAGSLLPFLFLILGPVRADSLPPYSAVVPGLDYLNYRVTNQQPWSIHIARLDRSHADLEVVSTLAHDRITGISTVAAQVRSLPPRFGKPLAAINGDFFVIAKGPYQGDPLGLQILRSELVSAPAGPSFWLEPRHKFGLGNITRRFMVTLPHGAKFRFGLNEERKADGIVLFTPTFGTSTRTTNGLELVLEKAGSKAWLPLYVDKTYSARVREVRATDGNTPLPPDTAVLSIGPKMAPKFSELQPGALLQISTAASGDISRAEMAIGGRPILITHGHEEQWRATGTNTLPRHPRTAIGWNKEYFYFVVVDGRQKELSMGMTFPELAHFLKDLGCTEALNLDGGGSTTFWLDGKIMNSPSDKHERSVANALVIVEHPPALSSPRAGRH